MKFEDALAHVKRLCPLLDAQAAHVAHLERYYRGDHPIPKAVTQNRATESYKQLMSMAQSNWPQLIVDSVEERLEVQSFTFSDEATSKLAGEIWQKNSLDADAGLAHQAALIGGRSYAIVWGDDPEIVLDHGSCVYVEYADGSQRDVVRALRRWKDAGQDRWMATLYTADGIYKFQQSTKGGDSADSSKWDLRSVSGEEWPLVNDTGRPPVFEIAVNRSLTMDRAKRARGEYEAAVAMVDRLNYTMFSMLAAMTWSGFPLRVLTGEPIDWKPQLDSDGNPVLDPAGNPVMKPEKPFDIAQDRIAQLENPDARVHQFQEATLSNYISTIEMQVKHLAAVTKTPAHYLLGEMVNLSADAIRAAEAGLISKVRRHQRSLGEAWEEIMRYALQLAGADSDDESAEVQWKDPESRSLAERADAAVKLAGVLPWSANAEYSLGATKRQLEDWMAMRAHEQLLASITPPAEPSDPSPAQPKEPALVT